MPLAARAFVTSIVQSWIVPTCASAVSYTHLDVYKRQVQSLRVQSDKIAYKKYMQDVVLHQEHLSVREACVEKVLAEEGKIKGVLLSDGTIEEAKIVIITSGTFMSSNILVGHTSTPGGPDGEPTTPNLSQSLRDLGLRTFRLKTGTPARVLTDSIDFSRCV